MSHKEELLSQEELGFLLTDYGAEHEDQRDPSNDPWSSEDTDAVTLRGDLIDKPFQEVLLSVADDEGVLRLLNPMEEHYLHIRSGSVQDLVVKRHMGRRVGKRLVAAGALGETQLEEALRIHKRDGHPLGKVLVSQGFVKADQVARQIEDQSVEDFYSLFTWSVGQYEYRPGPPAPEHRESFAELPQFDIERVVAEVANRRDEWQRILCAPDGLDSVVKPLRAAAVRLPTPHATILRNLDGEQSLRELAETTMLGLFECARAVKDLYDWKMVESAEPAQLLAIARSRLVSGEPKRAAMILQSLWTRLDPKDHEFASELADALQRCGENRIAARCLLRTAESCELGQEALEFARKAHKADPRSLEVLTFLRDRLLDTQADGKEAADIACALTDALAREEKYEEALDVITPFAKPVHESVIPFGRKVRLLCRLGSQQEAVSELLQLAKHYEEKGDRHRQAGVYENILRIDGDRTDLAAKIKAVKPKPRGPLITGVRVAILIVAAGISGLVFVNHQSAMKLQALTSTVSELLDRGDPDRALRELDRDQDFLGHPVTDSLRERALGMIHERQVARDKRESELKAALSRAAEHMLNGEFGDALQIYGELREQPDWKQEVLASVQTRFGALRRELEDLVRDGELRLPPEPDPTTPERKLDATLQELEKSFEKSVLVKAEGILAAHEHPVLIECVGSEKVGRLTDLARRAEQILRVAEERKQQFRKRLAERFKKNELGPLAEAAEAYVATYRFREARDKYRELIERYPDPDDPILVKFKADLQRCDDMVKALDKLADATARGETSLAEVLFGYLEKNWPEVPWKTLVELPLWVESIPAGARIEINGVSQGTTEQRLLTRYHPGTDLHIKASRNGFATMERTLQEIKPLVRIFLPKTADLDYKPPGVVMSRARVHVQENGDGQIFLADRSGTVTALDRWGAKLWEHKMDVLSGWLPTPLVFDESVVLTSREGLVQCLDTSGHELWSADGVACEGAPARSGDKMLAGTIDSRLVVLDPVSGDKIDEIKLPGEVHTDLVAQGDRVYVATRNAWLVCLSGAGAVLWRKEIGVACEAAPCVTDELAIGATIEGYMAALDNTTGEKKWERYGLGEFTMAPAHGPQYVFAVDSQTNTLISLRLADGKNGPQQRQTTVWCTPPVVVDDKLLIGDRSGTVSVFETEKLGLLYTIKGKAAVMSISPTPLGVVVTFEDKTVLLFRQL